MTRKLQIDELFVGNFGGPRNQQIRLPGPGLVVVYGSNESGKSTASTLMSWLLVGPYGSAETAQRFGQPGERLTGHLVGSFNGDPLRIDGQFNVLKSGAPNSAGVKTSFDTKVLSIDEWRHRIGGIDPVVLNAVYRMWGGDLHDSSGILAEVAQVALAGLGAGVRLGEVRERLERGIKDALTSNAKGVESRRVVLESIKTVSSQIKAIEAKGEEYTQLTQRILDLDLQVSEATDELRETSVYLGSLKTLLSVDAERREEKQISEEIEQLEKVPDSWIKVMENYASFSSLASELNEVESRFKSISADVGSRARLLGFDTARAMDLAVTASAVSSVARIQTQLHNAENEAEQIHQDLLRKTEDLRVLESQTRASLAGLEDAGISVERLAVPREDELRSLEGGLAKWREADQQAQQTRARVSSSQEKVDAATAVCEQTRVVWDRFGTGLTARQWTLSPKASVSVAAGQSTARNAMYVGLLAIAIVVVSVLVLPRIASAIIAGVILVALGAATSRKIPVSGAASEPQSGEALAIMAESANQVVAAEGVLEVLKNTHASEEAAHNAALRTLSDCRDAVMTEFRNYGIRDERTLLQIDACLKRLGEYRLASVDRDRASESVEALEKRLDDARRASAELLEKLGKSLADVNVPSSIDTLYAAENIESFQELTVQCSILGEVKEALKSLESRWHDFTGGFDSSSDEPSRARVVIEAERLWDLHQKQSSLMSRKAELEVAITNRLRMDSRAKELSTTLRVTSLIEDEIERASKKVDDLADRMKRTNQEVGEARNRQNELADMDRLRELNLELGQLKERAEELLVRGAVLSSAKSILDIVSNQRRHTHQPELIARANALLTRVIPDWETLLLDPTDTGSPTVTLVRASGQELDGTKLSTGAQAVTNLAIRIATAQSDGERRQVKFPLICDDPLVHLDDDRARTAMALLDGAAREGHQVILFTCHGRTVEAGEEIGAPVVRLS